MTGNTHIKSQCKNKCHKKIIYFPDNNDCETPYIDIYIDLLSINFNLMSALLCYVYDHISDTQICTALTTI